MLSLFFAILDGIIFFILVFRVKLLLTGGFSALMQLVLHLSHVKVIMLMFFAFIHH